LRDNTDTQINAIIKMSFRILATATLLCVSVLTLLAQRTTTQHSPYYLYQSATELLEKKQYEAARKKFVEYRQGTSAEALHHIDADYWQAHCAKQLLHPDLVQQLNRHLESYPQSPWYYNVLFDLGTYYFYIKSYDKAIEYLSNIPDNTLAEPKQSEAEFKLAYSCFQGKQLDRAAPIFEKLKRKENPYRSQVYYYTAYLNFKDGKYDAALSDLANAENDPQFEEHVPVLKANIYYRKKEYDKVLEIGEKTKASSTKVQGLEDLSLLVGECYFARKDYKNAVDYLGRYFRSQKGNVPEPLLYRVAFAQYKTGDIDNAISGFTKVAAKLDTAKGKKDTLGQYASYYLGDCYLRKNNKQFALAAFDVASILDADEEIQQAAWFQYGKLEYDLGRFNEAAETLREFLSSYPKSSYANEARELAGEALLNSNNYDAALTYIEEMQGKSDRLNTTYQRVTFQKGVQFFNERKMIEAAQMFEKSNKTPSDKAVFAASQYWLGEALSAEKQFDKAVNAYAGVFKISEAESAPYGTLARYGIGYAYYNLKQYDKALPHFREYISRMERSNQTTNVADAYLRLADCHYVAKDYNTAIRNYDKALDLRITEPEYAYYQKGLIYSILLDYDKARTNFSIITEKYKSSKFYDGALYQKAQMEFESGNYQLAANSFTGIINTMPESPIIPFVYLKRALSNFNLKNYDKAAADYKVILDKYPGHKTANSAMLGLQETLAITGNMDELSEYVAKFKRANPESDALESIEFETCKNMYFNQKYDKAIKALEDYLKNYPDNAFTAEAQFLLAESYYRQGNRSKALELHKQFVALGRTSNYAKSLARIAELELGSGNANEAIRYYKRLNQAARSKKDQNSAAAGMMEAYYLLGKYDSVLTLAEGLQNQEGASIDVQNKASLFTAKVHIQKKEYDKAMDELLSTVNNARDAIGAEAQYLIGLVLFEQGKYNESLAALFDLKSTYSNQPKWYNKGFLLIADNYVALKENFQAQATLRSIIENAKDKETIDAAKAKLQAISSPD
jgi:TolA-binding protein